MDVMYFAWLPNSVEIDKAIQLPQFRLRRTVQYDCSQNYTGGWSHLSDDATQRGLASGCDDLGVVSYLVRRSFRIANAAAIERID